MIRDNARNRWFFTRIQVYFDPIETGGSATEPLDRAALEQLVENILAQREIEQNKNIEPVYRLAEIYEKEGLLPEAIKLYEAALRSDSANLFYQNRMAQLLLSSGRPEEALDRLLMVYQYAEEPELISQAAGTLSEYGIDYLPEQTICRRRQRSSTGCFKKHRTILPHIINWA